MQINSGKLSLAWAYEQISMDPCVSIAAGAKVLASFAGYNAGSSRSPAGMGLRYPYISSRIGGQPEAAVAPEDRSNAVKPVPLRDALHDSANSGLIDLLSGLHPKKPLPEPKEFRDQT